MIEALRVTYVNRKRWVCPTVRYYGVAVWEIFSGHFVIQRVVTSSISIVFSGHLVIHETPQYTSFVWIIVNWLRHKARFSSVSLGTMYTVYSCARAFVNNIFFLENTLALYGERFPKVFAIHSLIINVAILRNFCSSMHFVTIVEFTSLVKL